MSPTGPPQPVAAPVGAVLDPRTLQANERTLLAWLRTGISLMAFGFVVARFGAWLSMLRPVGATSQASTAWVGVVLVGFGAAANLLAGYRYHRVRHALLHNEPVAMGEATGIALAVGLAVLGAALCVLLYARLE